jgi:hypothetical protein
MEVRRIACAGRSYQQAFVSAPIQGIVGEHTRVHGERVCMLPRVAVSPDTRAYLAGWEALGHLLVATQAGTSDAVSIIGNLGRDPEKRYTAKGAAVTGFSVAARAESRGGSTRLRTSWR